MKVLRYQANFGNRTANNLSWLKEHIMIIVHIDISGCRSGNPTNIPISPVGGSISGDSQLEDYYFDASPMLTRTSSCVTTVASSGTKKHRDISRGWP